MYLWNDNPVQRPEEYFWIFKNISKNYQFAVNKEGLVFMRQRSCWCLEGVAAMIKGNLQCHGDSKRVVKCDKYYSLGDTTNDVYRFSKHPCRKTSGPRMAKKLRWKIGIETK